MAKKSLKQRILFFERLENLRKNNHKKLRRRMDVHKRNISFIRSGFSHKEDYIDAVSEGFLNLRDFKERTGFSLYSVYKKRLASGFSTRIEWEEALKKGFENKDESTLARRLNINDKISLVALVTEELLEEKKEVTLIESEVQSFKKLISAEFDQKRLMVYKNEIIGKQKKLVEMSDIHETLHVIDHDDFALLLVIFENRRSKLLKDISNHLEWIETRFPYLEKWNKVLDVVNSFHVNIPVQLDRVAELAELDENEVKQLLVDILSEIPNLGEFLQREQVFIKKTKSEDELDLILDEMKQRQTSIDHRLLDRYCLHCGHEVASTDLLASSLCAKCDEPIPICHICRGYIFKGDDILVEENCGNLFHKRHILEWVNVQGKCPICRSRINEKSLNKIN